MHEIRKITSKEDIEKCIDTYLVQNKSVLRVDRQYAISRLYKHIIENSIALLIETEQGFAWILAAVSSTDLTPDKVILVRWYGSSFKGIPAANALKALHFALIDIANKKRINYIIASGSQLDEKNLYSKLLERFGWIREGHTAIWRRDDNC